jgi:hypothetical protein
MKGNVTLVNMPTNEAPRCSHPATSRWRPGSRTRQALEQVPNRSDLHQRDAPGLIYDTCGATGFGDGAKEDWKN